MIKSKLVPYKKKPLRFNKLIEKAARDLVNSKYAIALTGAGISTESGIPDFRGLQESGPKTLKLREELIGATRGFCKTQRGGGKKD